MRCNSSSDSVPESHSTSEQPSKTLLAKLGAGSWTKSQASTKRSTAAHSTDPVAMATLSFLDRWLGSTSARLSLSIAVHNVKIKKQQMQHSLRDNFHAYCSRKKNETNKITKNDRAFHGTLFE
ncbi:hypothetical protein T4E_338 [Trichinella pseudospiralis]|uniref:Uncharacterized protein n=1 Tax=Trichinella pseudospiralis TaxID=6337 RepID=A0A0V0YB19_TRIPS|nr:hypothetical protein T4E_338 [Trichinella pseudospiralis]KRY83689.1 hypothetical protein T4D_13606 [Trichinella pseudospiralis]